MTFVFNVPDLILLFVFALLYGKAMQASGIAYVEGRNWEWDAAFGLVCLFTILVWFALSTPDLPLNP